MRLIFFVILLSLFSMQCLAEDEDTTAITVKRKWFIPDHYQLQFAGNIGFFSGGLGYASRKHRLETELFFGYVPLEFGGPLSSITLKETYIPFKPFKTAHYNLDLFTMGLYFNYTFGKQFFVYAQSKDQYPKHYYDYSSALRTGLFVGGRIHRKIEKGTIEKIGLYYDLGTYDLAVHNYIFNINKSRFTELFNLALGLKLFLKD